MRILLLATVFLLFHDVDNEMCRTSLHQDQRSWMSTKTGYRQLVSRLDDGDHDNNGEQCSPVHLWTIVRHGTRYPSKDAILLMKEDLPRLRDMIVNSENSQLCDTDMELLRNWSVEIETEWSKNLHVEGEKEMILLGERWLNRYPELLSQYEPSVYRLRSTDTQRSLKSGESFITGLWSRVAVSQATWHVSASGHDPLIRFYKLCDKWVKDVKKNKVANRERDQFEQSEAMLEVARTTSELLGVEVTLRELDMMYVMCNFDLAWHPSQVSPWCRMFSDHDLKVMEYREDLEYYWIDGPGHNINSEPACVLIKDVLETFTNISNGSLKLNGTFYFTHSGTILKLLAHLNLFTDTEPLTSENFHKMEDRKWRTSKIGPFGANVAFVLQQCAESGFNVGLFVNENLTLLPGCDSMWCPLSKFIENFHNIENCDLEEICFKDDMSDSVEVPDDKY